MGAHWRLSAWYFAYFAFIGAFLPYFSLYLESLGTPAAEIGILVAVGQVMRMAVPAAWGWLSDRTGRRVPVIRWSALLSLVAFVAYYGADRFLTLLIVTALLHFFWSGALPLMEALTFAHLRDNPERYGRIRLWGSIGFIVAVSGVGISLDYLPVGSFLLSGALLLAAVAASACLLAEAPAVEARVAPPRAARLIDRPVLALLVAGFFMAAAHGPFYVFYSIHLVDHGYGKALTGALWSVGVIAEILVFLWMPRIGQRFGLRPILLACFALAVVRFLVIGWHADSLALLVGAQLLHAATFGAHHAATVSALHRWFPVEVQGRVQALYGSASFGAGGMAGAILAGQLWERAGPQWTFAAAAAIAAAGLATIVLWMREEPSGTCG